MTGISAGGQAPSSLRREQTTEALAGYAFIAVPMAIFLVLNIGAIAFMAFISVWDWGVRAGPREFLGVENYVTAFEDPIFWRAVWNTVRYALIVVPLQMALGLFLAVIVNQRIRGQTFFRAAFYFPAIASSAAITVLFIFMMSPQGLFNDIRALVGPLDIPGWFGFPPNHSWLGHSSTALESIMILNAWTTSGTMMLFYLASLQTISRETYEAAAIDGAGPWQTFWRITFPLLKPGHYFVATVSFIGALQVFDQAYIAGGPDGSPNNALTTIVLFLVRNTVFQVDFGFAAAVGVILFILIMAVTLIQRRLFGAAPAWY
ncbi:MAG TPA: sugar ABC transporter permease [candidate division Zixibacteria bacterium]|nr:sugar ABC transporter permease [candidate division Zixibacteria bacterium]